MKLYNGYCKGFNKKLRAREFHKVLTFMLLIAVKRAAIHKAQKAKSQNNKKYICAGVCSIR